MSATATSQEVRQPVSRLGGWIAGAIAVIALAVIIVAAVASFVIDTGPAITYETRQRLVGAWPGYAAFHLSLGRKASLPR